MTVDQRAGDLLREIAPQVLAALARRHRAFAECEDAVQDAVTDALVQWPQQGIPANPRGWLTTVATRRLIDQVRSDRARRLREERIEVLQAASAPDGWSGRDDSLILLFLCCHPALTPPTQIALTLRAVGGLTTAEIASAFFLPEATMAQRISRAKRGIRQAGATFAMPPPGDLPERLQAVLHVLYLIFTEGHTASAGPDITRPDLTREAIRLTRELLRQRPDDSDVKGLLALMLLTEARRDARTAPDGQPIQLADQDRSRWNRQLISEGANLAAAALATGPPGAYQLQAAIAAVHDEAGSAQDTDWPQILLLYQLLDAVAPNPMATLNRALAVAMVHGPQAGLDLLATLDQDRRVASHHRLHAMRGHLLELAGQPEAARAEFELAARLCLSRPEREDLRRRASALSGRAAGQPPTIAE